MVTVAAVQATPVFLDREATADKVCALIQEAADHGAELIVFPESFIPAYPDWVWRTPAWTGHRVRAAPLRERGQRPRPHPAANR